MSNSELLSVLEHLEREKGIKKEILIAAVESALVSAAKKVVDVNPDGEFKVEFDRLTGSIKAFVDGKQINSAEFGRIAAQTEKQEVKSV